MEVKGLVQPPRKKKISLFTHLVFSNLYDFIFSCNDVFKNTGPFPLTSIVFFVHVMEVNGNRKGLVTNNLKCLMSPKRLGMTPG